MYKALISFSGLVTMAKGEIKELKDEGIIKDLLRAGYIEEVKKDTEKIIKNEIKKDVEKIVEDCQILFETKEELNEHKNTAHNELYK